MPTSFLLGLIDGSSKNVREQRFRSLASNRPRRYNHRACLYTLFFFVHSLLCNQVYTDGIDDHNPSIFFTSIFSLTSLTVLTFLLCLYFSVSNLRSVLVLVLLLSNPGKWRNYIIMDALDRWSEYRIYNFLLVGVLCWRDYRRIWVRMIGGGSDMGALCG